YYRIFDKVKVLPDETPANIKYYPYKSSTAPKMRRQMIR
ncbi:hypothetical protein ALO_04678, partial [Acetonema longum DSM 6540]